MQAAEPEARPAVAEPEAPAGAESEARAGAESEDPAAAAAADNPPEVVILEEYTTAELAMALSRDIASSGRSRYCLGLMASVWPSRLCVVARSKDGSGEFPPLSDVGGIGEGKVALPCGESSSARAGSLRKAGRVDD